MIIPFDHAKAVRIDGTGTTRQSFNDCVYTQRDDDIGLAETLKASNTYHFVDMRDELDYALSASTSIQFRSSIRIRFSATSTRLFTLDLRERHR